MGYVASYVLPGGHTGEIYFSSKAEIEAWKKAHPKGKLLNLHEKTPRKPKLNVPTVDDVIRNKYGISQAELKRMVQQAKSQPELIRMLRKKLTGSTKYDPRYHDLEMLASKMYEEKEFKGAPFSGDIKNQLDALKKHLLIANTPGNVEVVNGKIVPLKIDRNTGIKTVPAHKTPIPPEELKPLIAPAPTPAPVKTTAVSVPAEKKGVNWLLILGLIGAGFVLMKLMR